jgi:hypothetical protein
LLPVVAEVNREFIEHTMCFWIMVYFHARPEASFF